MRSVSISRLHRTNRAAGERTTLTDFVLVDGRLYATPLRLDISQSAVEKDLLEFVTFEGQSIRERR